MSSAVIWFCVAIAFFVGEALTLAFIMLFLGIGALAAAAYSLFDDNLVWSLLLFSGMSVASLFLLRGRLLRRLKGRSHSSSDNAQNPSGAPEQPSQIGRIGTVAREITSDKEGQIALGGSFWRAVSHEVLPEGTSVQVVGAHPENEILLLVTQYHTPVV